MLQILLVATGGAVGAISRFSLTYLMQFFIAGYLGTLLINIIGSFLIGYFISIGYLKSFSEEFIRYFLIIGFLGSFTTFSAFSYEVIELILSKKMLISTIYIFSSVFLCILSAYIGMSLNRFWLKLLKLKIIITSD